MVCRTWVVSVRISNLFCLLAGLLSGLLACLLAGWWAYPSLPWCTLVSSLILHMSESTMFRYLKDHFVSTIYCKTKIIVSRIFLTGVNRESYWCRFITWWTHRPRRKSTGRKNCVDKLFCAKFSFRPCCWLTGSITWTLLSQVSAPSRKSTMTKKKIAPIIFFGEIFFFRPALRTYLSHAAF